MSDNYRTTKVHKDKVSRAKKKGMTVNEYIDHLEALVDTGRTTEQDNILERLKASEGAIGSMAEVLKHQRYLTDTQSRKIDDQNKVNQQNAEMLAKLLNAFSAKLAFIEALEKEITQ